MVQWFHRSPGQLVLLLGFFAALTAAVPVCAASPEFFDQAMSLVRR